MARRIFWLVGSFLALPLAIFISHIAAGGRESILELDLSQVEPAVDIVASTSDGLATMAVSLVIASSILLRLTDSRPIARTTALLAISSAAFAVSSIFLGYRMKVDLASLLLMDRREGVPMEDLRHVLRLLRMQGTALVLSASFLVSTATDSLWLRPRAAGGGAA